MLRFALALTLAVLALPSAATAAVSTPHSGWLWGLPEPQGHDLNTLELQGASGFAAGEFGTLLATGNGGSSWTAIHTGTEMTFQRMDVIGPQSVVVGSECALRRTDDGGATFRRLPFTTSERQCARRVRSLSFPTPTVGYLLLEDGGVLKTADGGESFASLTGVPTGARAIAFASAEHGIIATTGGELYRTTDGGATWTLEFDANLRLNALYVAGNTAVAVGELTTFLVSNDGGDTWAWPAEEPDAPERFPHDFTSVRCSPGGVCLMTSGNDVFRTADGGRTFQAVSNVTAQAVDFSSASRAVAVGPRGATFLSDDAGNSFARLGTRLTESFQITRVRATSADVAHVAGLPRVVPRTVDGGETWVEVGVPTSRDVRDVAFPTAELGYALDDGGGLFRTRNGGATWSVLETNAPADARAVVAPDDDLVLLVGPRGLRRSTDGGDSFSIVRDRDVRLRTLANVDRAGGALIAYGPRVLLMSTNDGRTWRRIVRPSQRAEVNTADFVSPRRGFVSVTGGRAYTTRDGGTTWAELIGLGAPAGRDLAFGSSRSGWISSPASPSTVLRTTDGGRSWHPQVIGDGPEPLLAAAGGQVGFAALSRPGEGAVLFTRSGGDFGADSRLTITTRRRVVDRRRTIELTGRLVPAGGGEQVEVRIRRLGGGTWRSIRATVDDDGRFAVDYRLTRNTVFVAQWAGDADTAGDGSAPLVVRLDRSRR